ncbi:unnamed protein product [Urochloa decumbens]|uniref:Replication factor A C-terminal domain-containing protein n=1 Tax=Urochloa decumbens TaxID=240449 RepID=A0ABC8VSY2_9POAL
MGGGLDFDLSRGAVPALWSCALQGPSWCPVLQVADARHVPDGSGLRPAPEQRYRIDLSDGVHSQPGTLAASLNHLVRDGALRRGTVVRLLDFARYYHRRTIAVIRLEILQTECALIGSLKIYEPIRKHYEPIVVFNTRSMKYARRPHSEHHFGGQHIDQSCIASEVEESANGLSYHGPHGGSTLPCGDMPCSVAQYAEPPVWKTVRQIKDEYLGYLDEPDFITLKAVIAFMNTDRLCSAACPMVVNGKRCNVKATGDGDGTWHCKACTQSYGSCDYGIWHCKRCGHSFDSCDYGYSVRIRIQDHTGTTFATVYGDAAKEIFGCNAKDLYLMEYEERNYNRLEGIKLGVACKEYILWLKVKAKPFSDPRGVGCVVLKAENVNPSAESRRLLGGMGTHLWEGLDSRWELGSSKPTSWDLSDSKGRSTDRARWLCSPDRYSQQANKYDVKPSAHSSFGAYGCGDHGSGIDGQRSWSPDFFVDRVHGASGIDGQRSWSPDFFVDRFHGTSGTDGQRSWSPDFFVDRFHGTSGTDGQRSWSPDFFVDRVHGTTPAVNLAPDVRCTRSKRTAAHGAGRSARKP